MLGVRCEVSGEEEKSRSWVPGVREDPDRESRVAEEQVARRDEPATEARHKLSVVREAVRGAYPTADIEQMLAETERGYLGGEHP